MSRPSSGRDLSQASTPAAAACKPEACPVESDQPLSSTRVPRIAYYPPLFSYSHTKRNARIDTRLSSTVVSLGDARANAHDRQRPSSAPMPSSTLRSRRPTRAETSGIKELSWTIGTAHRAPPDINSRRSLHRSRLPPSATARLQHLEDEAINSPSKEAREAELERLRDNQAATQKEFIERRDQTIEKNSRLVKSNRPGRVRQPPCFS